MCLLSLLSLTVWKINQRSKRSMKKIGEIHQDPARLLVTSLEHCDEESSIVGTLGNSSEDMISQAPKLFVYGSLISPEVVQTLLGRLPKAVKDPATICGFSRHPVREFAFPGLVRSSETSKVQGIMYEDLTENEMRRLDWFEGDEYQKIPVSVSCSGAASVNAYVYLWDNPLEELDLHSSWCYQSFREHNLATYIEETVKPCRQELDSILPR